MDNRLIEAIDSHNYKQALPLIPPHYAEIDGMNLFLYACWKSSPKIAKAIFATGSYDINQEYKSLTAFSASRQFILKSEGVYFLKWLIKNGLDVNHGESDDSSPLMYLIYHDKGGNQLDKIKLLLESGANYNITKTKHNILFQWLLYNNAFSHKDLNLLESMLEKLSIQQINTLCPDNEKKGQYDSVLTKTLKSLTSNMPDVLALFVKYGADTNALVHGKTIFMHLCDYAEGYVPQPFGFHMSASEKQQYQDILLKSIPSLFSLNTDLSTVNHDGINLEEYLKKKNTSFSRQMLDKMMPIFEKKLLDETLLDVSGRQKLKI